MRLGTDVYLFIDELNKHCNFFVQECIYIMEKETRTKYIGETYSETKAVPLRQKYTSKNMTKQIV